MIRQGVHRPAFLPPTLGSQPSGWALPQLQHGSHQYQGLRFALVQWGRHPLGLGYCLEQLLSWLQLSNQVGGRLHIILAKLFGRRNFDL